MKSVRAIRTCRVAAILGVIAFIVGISLNGVSADDLRTVGAVIAICGVCSLLVLPLTRSHVDMYQSGHEAGYDVGFYEGHRTARPVVVPIHIPQDASALVERHLN